MQGLCMRAKYYVTEAQPQLHWVLNDNLIDYNRYLLAYNSVINKRRIELMWRLWYMLHTYTIDVGTYSICTVVIYPSYISEQYSDQFAMHVCLIKVSYDSNWLDQYIKTRHPSSNLKERIYFVRKKNRNMEKTTYIIAERIFSFNFIST